VVLSLNALSPVHADGYWFTNALRFGDSFGAQLVLDFLVAGLALLAAVLVRHRRPRHGLTPWAVCLVAGSLVVIAISTLTRRAGATSPGHLQLTPFGTLSRYLHDPADFLIYLAGNVALFVPLGFFLYLAVRRSMVLCTAVATLVSVGVEILQLPIYSRASDIDDVITNGLGALIGVVLGVVVLRIAPFRQRRDSGLGMTRVVPAEPGLRRSQQQDQPHAGQSAADGRPALAGQIGRGPDGQVPQAGPARHDHHENAL